MKKKSLQAFRHFVRISEQKICPYQGEILIVIIAPQINWNSFKNGSVEI